MCRTKVRVSPWAVVLVAAFVALSDWSVVLSLLMAALVHEAGHYAAIRLCGGRVGGVAITAFGVEMAVRGRLRYGAEMAITAAGPLVNGVFALLLAWMGQGWYDAYLLSGAQAVLGAFNLLPVRPLDGGQLLWLAVAWLTEPYTADRVSRIVSLAVSFAFAFFAAVLLQRTGEGMFLLFGALVLTYHAIGEKPRR